MYDMCMVKMIRKSLFLEVRQIEALNKLATTRTKFSELVRKAIDMLLEAQSKKD
jgi:hypothetical protein